MSPRRAEKPLPRGRFRFRTVRHLGSGGFGEVDEIVVVASNGGLPVGHHYARKRLNAAFNIHPEARERFEREIVQVRAMEDISGVVSYRGENLPGGERFYVMDLFPGNLREYLAQHPNGRPWKEVAGFCASVARTMAEAHRRGFVHRDLKPENILLTRENGHVIADWGLGYFLHQHSKVLRPLTRGGMGSAYYCSMEQWASGKCDERGDIYSLGMLAAELVVGRQILIAHQGAGVRMPVAGGSSTAALLFDRLVREMTMVLEGDRPNSMANVAFRFRAVTELSG